MKCGRLAPQRKIRIYSLEMNDMRAVRSREGECRGGLFKTSIRHTDTQK